MKILNVIGARPNFIKIAPLLKAAKSFPSLEMVLVHTGQHYDYNMSRIFFKDLSIPEPDIHLKVGSAGLGHGEQTGLIMERLEEVSRQIKPEMMVVVGDVNSTLGGALVAAKLQIPLAHIEAGLRSYDRRMPEEINRVVTDVLSDYLFTPYQYARQNLLKEGIASKKIFVVGNIMADALKQYFRPTDALHRLGLRPACYAMVTLHRPVNVDDKNTLKGIMQALKEIASNLTVVFPVHPRTHQRLETFRLMAKADSGNLVLIGPLGYLDNLNLIKNARMVLTDSGGVQQEAMVLGTPCLTLRETTEWVDTVKSGMNKLVGNKPADIIRAAKVLLGNQKINEPRLTGAPDAVARRILKVLVEKRYKETRSPR
ncbi:MAG: UDP-N-acetylglucosamine 2-epimerase (non-hydrolyzing) [Planctomycetes bacterium]|nr:UDP-N-acetylglucosamine 2-epimerase (non-hydrolyzing) [Planctomycetota bacterium]